MPRETLVDVGDGKKCTHPNLQQLESYGGAVLGLECRICLGVITPCPECKVFCLPVSGRKRFCSRKCRDRARRKQERALRNSQAVDKSCG